MAPSAAPMDVAAGIAATTTHFSSTRVYTEVSLAQAFRAAYPGKHLSISQKSNIDILKYAKAGHATYEEIDPESSLKLSLFVQKHNHPKYLQEKDLMTAYKYTYQGTEHMAFVTRWEERYSTSKTTFMLSPSKTAADALLTAAGEYCSVSHNEMWMFDRTEWSKSTELWDSVANASWDDVVLEPSMKTALQRDVEGFFGARPIYNALQVPWKRGVIFHGPPGTGKTCTIKALLNAVSRSSGVQCLYVKSTSNQYQGPEAALRDIFEKARAVAPCVLVFEDVDSLITPKVRSYFLNEIDGLESNDGILMVASTNHLDRLDAGIAKRPSRFDRKYHFGLPGAAARAAYSAHWRRKLAANPRIAFPEALDGALAAATEGFSFAYLKELFVASLLLMAHRIQEEKEGEEKEKEDGQELETCELWRILEPQVAVLREEMEAEEREREEEERKEAERKAKGEDTVEEEEESEKGCCC
ncbi:P-loop containing nucleoside triphosphate hydrolase protein [Geopyxis carbonaria]|nr:P-loop containing nucleoside triphosphate hydrolase protein [Geopyxis carbonaria]